jgi:hypothetical protein
MFRILEWDANMPTARDSRPALTILASSSAPESQAMHMPICIRPYYAKGFWKSILMDMTVTVSTQLPYPRH